MVSTMALPPVPSLPTFAGPHGPQNPMVGAYYSNPPVVLQPHIIPTAPIVNGSTTEGHLPPQSYNHFRFPMIPVGGGCYNDGMQVVWHGEFSRLFSSFLPLSQWYLSITDVKPAVGKWKCHGDSAKVRFCCQDCGNGWTSMKGRVTFWYCYNSHTKAGFVYFKLYGQVCKKCNCGRFEFVMWYPEEVAKVMFNLYTKVGQAYFHFPPTQIRVDRRPGRPRNQHNADLCQACRDGECDQGRPAKAVIGYMPTDMSNRVTSHQILPVVNPQMPVLIGQPSMTHCGPVMAHGMNPPASGTIVPCVGNPPNFITAPVTISSSMQPILTYTVGTPDVKEVPKLSTLEEHAEDSEPDKEESKADVSNGHCSENEVEGKQLNQVQPPTQTTTPDVKPIVNNMVVKSPSPESRTDEASPKKTSPVPTTVLVKSQVNGGIRKIPIRSEKEPSMKISVPADNAMKEPPSTAKGKVLEKPIMNGYASAARKAVSKPALLVNGNA